MRREWPELENEKSTMEKTRKRTKFATGEVPETPQPGGKSVEMGYVLATPGIKRVGIDVAAERKSEEKKYDISKRAIMNKPKKKRSGTPPLMERNTISMDDMQDPNFEMDRAALTWHDHEITGFDPDDLDDDGRGLDGIGFKPTAARNDARALKKRQQLAEYRSRISSEARAKRSEKRRDARGVPTGLDVGGSASARVKFAAVEVETILI